MSYWSGVSTAIGRPESDRCPAVDRSRLMMMIQHFPGRWNRWFQPDSEHTGNGQILLNARRMTPVDVWISATRAMPSVPGWTATIRPSLHFRGGRLSSLITTKEPSFKPSLQERHLDRSCNSATYSLLHLLQKCWRSCSILWYRDRWLAEVSW